MFSFFYWKKDENTIKSIWEKIFQIITTKKDLPNLAENFNSLNKILKDDSKKINSESINYIKDNNILNQIIKFAINNQEIRIILLEYLSLFINQLKYISYIFEHNEDLFISLQNLIINLKKELEQKVYKFNIKTEFANILNSITRLLLNYPQKLSYFIIKEKKLYSNDEYEDFIIFSSLLKLLELDNMINSYNIKKNIRRSLIVFLSFDDINKKDYLLHNSFIVEIFVDKLCNYYQMLPSYFDIDKNGNSLEPSININLNCFKAIYFNYKDYIIFLDKIIRSFTNIQLKKKFENYFFNKFLIENVLPNLQYHNLKKFRSTLQYLLTLLKYSKNNKTIINPISYFLLGLTDELNDNNNISNNDNDSNNNNESNNDVKNDSNIQSNNNTQINEINEISEKSEENIIFYKSYLLNEYDPSTIRNKILKNIHRTKEYINIIIYELFNIIFQEKPFLSMKNFVSPYTDYVIKKSNNKAKFIFGTNTSYPLSNHLLSLLEKYLNNSSIVNNIECLLFKNLRFYINQDIDFYKYYLKNKQKEDVLLNQSKQSFNNNIEEASFRINEDIENSDEYSNNQDSLEENIMKGFNSNFMRNLISPTKRIKKTESNEIKKLKSKNEKEIIIKDIFENDKFVKEEQEENNIFINIDYNINFDYENNINKIKKESDKEENEDNIDLLFMKNLHHKIHNFEKNTNLENLLLFNLIITILSVPNFTFDDDLLKCNLILLDNDDKSKFSFLALFKHISNSILDKLNNEENEKNLKLILNEFGMNEYKNEKDKYKIGLNFYGFKNEENMNEQEKEKNKIINWIIFCEFIKEFISCTSQKYKFEELTEHLFSFFSEQLDEFYNDNINDDEENENNENENNENKDDERNKFF